MKKGAIIVIVIVIILLVIFILSKSMKKETKEETIQQPQAEEPSINDYSDLESDDDVFNEIDTALNYAE